MIYRVLVLSTVFLAGMGIFRYQVSLGQDYNPTPTQTPNHHVRAGVQALACEYPDQKPGCEMYIAGFTDTVNTVMVGGESTKMLCGSTDSSDLVAEFEKEARKSPEADTDAALFQLLKTKHMCEGNKAPIYNPRSAGGLIDMCHTGDIGFNLCSLYQWGFLDSLFFMSAQTKIPILCGNIDRKSPRLNS